MKIILFWLLWLAPAIALEADEILADPALEARARSLSAEIRCVTCAAQSVEDSPAPLARDIRQLIRTELQNGKGEAAIKGQLRDHYGDKILMSPPLTASTWLLWAGPALLLLIGLLIGRKMVKR